MDNKFFLNIPEEVYLLSIDDEGNQHENFRNQKFDVIIGSAVLMELAMRNVIDTDLKYVIPDKLEHTGDIILDEVIDEIKDYGDKRPISEWISHISMHGQFFRDEIIASLVGKRVLKIENKRTLWFFASRKYPLQNEKEVVEVRTRLRNLIFGDDIPDIRDIVIISVLYHGKLMDTVLTAMEQEKYSGRVAQISKMDFIGQAIADALDEFNLGDFLTGKIKDLLREKSPEEKLQEHIAELKQKYRIKSDDKLPDWLRKGTEQYEKTLEFVSKTGTAEITFNPRTKKYSKLNYSYYSHMGGSGA
jgi:hypothetical protein